MPMPHAAWRSACTVEGIGRFKCMFYMVMDRAFRKVVVLGAVACAYPYAYDEYANCHCPSHCPQLLPTELSPVCGNVARSASKAVAVDTSMVLLRGIARPRSPESARSGSDSLPLLLFRVPPLLLPPPTVPESNMPLRTLRSSVSYFESYSYSYSFVPGRSRDRRAGTTGGEIISTRRKHHEKTAATAPMPARKHSVARKFPVVSRARPARGEIASMLVFCNAVSTPKANERRRSCTRKETVGQRAVKKHAWVPNAKCQM